jgi:hypothetical protein
LKCFDPAIGLQLQLTLFQSLNGALRNELEKNAASLIPVEIVTEFVFAAASTITVSVAQQPALEELIQPADHLQSITVDYALCRDIDGKERLRVQRAIARYARNSHLPHSLT